MKDAIQTQLIAARRNQILDAAAGVFAEKGFHPTTIRDIAQAAGIADGTIYNYFENKTALLIGILDRMRASIQQDADFSDVNPADVRRFMRAYLWQPLLALKANNFELFRVVMSEIMVNHELRERYYQQILEPMLIGAEILLQTWVDQRLIKPINVRLTVRALSGMMLGLIVEHIMGDPTLEAEWDELPNFLTDLILDGLQGSEPP
ncbi:MAG: TetR/AcrR family transcriptional regulator [Chloroflexota bacterium]|nr:TetR/AcrR family transcriptional regulator [Chloroflexota bacterium]